MGVSSAFEKLKRGIAGEVRRNEPMSRHTSFRIGGPAALFVVCDALADVAHVLEVLAEEEVCCTPVGKGTNLLVSDTGYDGCVLALGKAFTRHAVEGERITAGAGTILAFLVNDAYRRGLAGMAFAVGIPGTLGGALVMNAGSKNDWIGGIVESVTLYVPGQGMTRVRGAEVVWGYRTSGLAGRGVVLEAVLRLRQGDPKAIRRQMETNFRLRKASQPHRQPSAGSVFANPQGDSAGRLIERAGLKGRKVGGARVSDMHANFIVNEGGATALDVITLMEEVRRTVEGLYGVELRPEIRFLGDFETA